MMPRFAAYNAGVASKKPQAAAKEWIQQEVLPMESKNKIELVVFDWAGTTVDYGSSAPSEVFDRVFRAAGLHLTKEEINRPMGLEKKAHIRELLSCESGRNQWQGQYGRPWYEEDVDALYEKFEATLHEVVAERSDPMDGVVETVNALRRAGLKIGSTTGYNDWMMEQVLPRAAAGGYSPDCVVTPDAPMPPASAVPAPSCCLNVCAG